MRQTIVFGAFLFSLAQALNIASDPQFEDPVLDPSFPLMHRFRQNVSEEQTKFNNNVTVDCNPMAVCSAGWSGRLGNNLYHLEELMYYARQNNYCYVKVPHCTGNCNIRDLINFPDDNVINAFPAARRHGTPQCAETLHGMARPAMDSVKDLRSTMAETISGRNFLKCSLGTSDMLTDETVVMHMRSGDIHGGMRYPQPPCSYYKLVMLEGRPLRKPFEKGVIITEPDMRNPCIQAMLDTFPGNIEVHSRSVTEDACTMISAKHLAIAFGTWGPALSRLNTNLMDLYVPWGEDGVTAEEYGGDLNNPIDAKHWYLQSVYKSPIGYRQHVYSFPGFTARQSQFDLVTNSYYNGQDIVSYSMDRINERIIPA